jgi:hypothetical protein
MDSQLLSRRQALVAGAALGHGALQAQTAPSLPTCFCRYWKSGGADPIRPTDKAVEKATPVVYNRDWNNGAPHPEQSTTVFPLWNERFLYLLFDCRYLELHIAEKPDLTKDQPIYERDCAEFFAAPDPAQVRLYREFEYSPAGEWFDARIENPGGEIKVDVAWNSGMKVIAGIDQDKKRWWASTAIPIAQIQVPKKGDRWRVNFYRIEGDPKHEPRTYMAWSPTMSQQPNFHVPDHFGWMVFQR